MRRSTELHEAVRVIGRVQKVAFEDAEPPMNFRVGRVERDGFLKLGQSAPSFQNGSGGDPLAVRTKIRPGTTTISRNTAARARDPSEHSNGVSVGRDMKYDRAA